MNHLPIPDTSLYQKMARGHLLRVGHPLTGYLLMNGTTATLIRTCCND